MALENHLYDVHMEQFHMAGIPEYKYKKISTKILQILSHMNDLDNVTLDANWPLFPQTIVGHWIHKLRHIQPLKNTCDITDILHLGPQCMYYYFPDDTTYGVLFWEMVLISNWNLIKIITAICERVTICFCGNSEGLLSFW
jgi:hypothetical protein